MDIHEFADVIQKEIVIRYYPNQDSRWSASFEHCEMKEGESCLKSTYRNGKTPHQALFNYSKAIAGELLIFNAYGDDRQEFMCPKSVGEEE